MLALIGIITAGILFFVIKNHLALGRIIKYQGEVKGSLYPAFSRNEVLESFLFTEKIRKVLYPNGEDSDLSMPRNEYIRKLFNENKSKAEAMKLVERQIRINWALWKGNEHYDFLIQGNIDALNGKLPISEIRAKGIEIKCQRDLQQTGIIANKTKVDEGFIEQIKYFSEEIEEVFSEKKTI